MGDEQEKTLIFPKIILEMVQSLDSTIKNDPKRHSGCICLYGFHLWCYLNALMNISVEEIGLFFSTGNKEWTK